MLGLCALLGGAFVTSNRESGDGRYDIQLKPTKKGLPGILIELKAEKIAVMRSCQVLSETALQQINDKKYETELTAAGVKTIYKYGVAFSGKKDRSSGRMNLEIRQMTDLQSCVTLKIRKSVSGHRVV